MGCTSRHITLTLSIEIFDLEDSCDVVDITHVSQRMCFSATNDCKSTGIRRAKSATNLSNLARTQSDWHFGAKSDDSSYSCYSFCEQHLKKHHSNLEEGKYCVPTFDQYLKIGDHIFGGSRSRVSSELAQVPTEQVFSKPAILEERKRKNFYLKSIKLPRICVDSDDIESINIVEFSVA